LVRRLITQYKKNADAKALADNFLYLSILQFIGYTLPFITLPYLAKTLGVEKFGILAFATAVMAYFQAFVDFGFNYTAVRDIARQKDDRMAVSKIFSTVMTIRVLFAVFAFLILLVLILLIPLFRNNRTILLLTFTYIPCYILFPEWLFQAMEKMKFITILNILSKLIFTILVFTVIKTHDDYVWQPILTSMGFLISGLLALIIISYKFRIIYYLPTIQEISRTIKNGWDMFVNIFLPNLYTNFSTILLRAYAGEASTGIFDAGNKFINITQQLTNVLSRAFYPFLARRMDKHSFYQRVSMTFSVIMTILLFFGANSIIGFFYTPQFKDSATVLRILSLSIVFLFLMNAYGTNYLVLINQEKKLKMIIVWCSVFGFALSWLAVIKWGPIGAAVTYLLVWALRGLITWRVAFKLKRDIECLKS
jgi:O-antigen/teichoic acid export membrane protein